MPAPAATWSMPLKGVRLLYMHESDTEILIGLETEKKAVSCPCCKSTAVVGYGKMIWRIRDLPVKNKAVFLEIKRRRLRCRDCLVTFNEPMSQISAHHRATARLVQSVWSMALRQPFITLSKILGMDEKTIRNIFNDRFEAAASQFTIQPRPPAPSALAIRLPVILRQQRVMWFNLDQGTLIDMNENVTREAIQETLLRVASNGAHKISVPPDAALIWALQAATRSPLILHPPSMRAACKDAIDLGRAIGNVASYVEALAQFVGARDAIEAGRLWQDLGSPPAELGAKMQPLMVAVGMLGPECFEAFGQPEHAHDALIDRLETILRTNFTRRSYDVICAIVLFDKALQKTARTGVAEHGAHLGYQKANYGTSILKLVAQLEKLTRNSEAI